MRKDVAHGRAIFAVGAELRPQLHHGCVVAEEAALHEHVRHGCGRALADRVGVERSVRSDRTPRLRIGDTSDGVDYLLAAPVNGDLQTPFSS
jgi:hypothetical protein